jgi:hypothetical protein
MAFTDILIPNFHSHLFMWILLLEAGIALALLILIVWWTLAGRRDRKPGDE